MKLTDREWGSFNITGDNGILNIESTESGIDKNKLMYGSEENIPYITRTELYNGINLFVQETQGSKYKLNDSNVITLGLDTQTVFYQPHEFFTGQNIQVLKSYRLNKHIALFLMQSIKIQMDKFNWGGNGATLGRLAKTKLMVPVDQYNEPDWDFMEAYIREREEEKIEKYKVYAESVITELEYAEVPKLSEKEWLGFELGGLFKEVKRGKRQVEGYRESGNVPFYSASKINNGLTDFMGNPLFIEESGAVIYSSMGDAFYANGNFSSSDDITILTSDKINKYSGLFIVRCINNNRNNYSYGRRAFTEKITRSKIVLPVTNEKEVDWEYIEQYVKNLMISKYKKYLEFKS